MHCFLQACSECNLKTINIVKYFFISPLMIRGSFPYISRILHPESNTSRFEGKINHWYPKNSVFYPVSLFWVLIFFQAYGLNDKKITVYTAFACHEGCLNRNIF